MTSQSRWQRLSIIFSGIAVENVERLCADDDNFYGSDSSDASDSSSGEERDPAAKRLYRDFSDWEGEEWELLFI